MRLAALLLVGIAFVARGNSYGQQTASLAADGGVTCAQLIERQFSKHSIPTEMARFDLHVRTLPFVGRARQISLVYYVDRKPRVRIVTFDGPICTALVHFESEYGRLPNQSEIALTQPRIVDLEIDPALAKQWMTKFWREMSEAARSSPAIALKGEVKSEVSVALDPNIYEFHYTDTDKSLALSMAGPNPERVEGREGLEPLVRWAIDVARQCEAIQRRQAK